MSLSDLLGLRDIAFTFWLFVLHSGIDPFKNIFMEEILIICVIKVKYKCKINACWQHSILCAKMISLVTLKIELISNYLKQQQLSVWKVTYLVKILCKDMSIIEDQWILLLKRIGITKPL